VEKKGCTPGSPFSLMENQLLSDRLLDR